MSLNKVDSFPKSVAAFISQVKRDYNIAKLKNCEGAVIFGTGQAGIDYARIFKSFNVNIFAFSDNNAEKWGKTIEGLPVISPKEIEKDRMIIVGSRFAREICIQLEREGYKKIVPHFVFSTVYPDIFQDTMHNGAINSLIHSKNEINQVRELLFDDESKNIFNQIIKFRTSLSASDLPEPKTEQYFPGKFWKLAEQETFVDVGAYDGDTMLQFINHSGGKFRKIITLEPDPINYAKLVGNIPNKYKKKVLPLCAGAGAAKGTVSFSSFGRADSKISLAATKKVKLVALDDICKDEPVTTIKMDVEGYEPEALKGSEKTIKNKSPKLAVCVYHVPSQLWELPLQIVGINPKYKFFLRHHYLLDTVLYAVPI